jgi:CHASE3 domain sensor protein
LLKIEKVSDNKLHSGQKVNTQTGRDSGEEMDEITARLNKDIAEKNVQRLRRQYETQQNYFNTLYRASFIILYHDHQMHNYFRNYHTPTCFDTIVSSSGSL